MQKLYCFLLLACSFSMVQAQQSACSATIEFRDSVSYAPFAHHVTFKAKATHAENKIIKKVCWKFGDGTQLCKEATAGTGGEALLTITHKYSTASATLAHFNVCVIIYYDGGCVAEKCISVPLQFPTTSTCAVNIRTQATNAHYNRFVIAAIPEHAQHKKPKEVCWKFGDGSETICKTYASTYTGTYAVEHTFERDGKYEVCVITKYEDGCESRKCTLVTVQKPAADTCAAKMEIRPTLSNPLAKHIIAVPANTTQNKAVEVCWKFGDGSPDVCKTYAATYTGTYSVEHRFPTAGNYAVCVQIKYQNGCVARSCQQVKIETPTHCSVQVHEVATTHHAQERKFYVGLMNDRKAEKICWRFGDGSEEKCVSVPSPVTEASLTTSHVFPAPGVYKVCVKVWYEGGCTAEKCMEVVIRPQATATCGGYMQQVLTDPHTVAFKGFSITGNNDQAVSYSWTFGDGHTGSGKEVKHQYAAAGNYQVCLLIKTASGCETKICQKVILESNTRPQLILSPNPASIHVNAQFFSRRTETVNIRIYNANGLLVRSFSKAAVTGENNWSLDIATLPIGVYSVVVHSNYQFANAIFFKQ